MRALCEGPVPTSTDDDGAPRETPADVAELESQVEQVRELEFLREVVVQPVSAEEIAGKLEGAFDETYPKAFYDRRSVAWQTLGVIPVSLAPQTIAFAGADKKTLYIVGRGAAFQVRLDAAGYAGRAK